MSRPGKGRGGDVDLDKAASDLDRELDEVLNAPDDAGLLQHSHGASDAQERDRRLAAYSSDSPMAGGAPSSAFARLPEDSANAADELRLADTEAGAGDFGAGSGGARRFSTLRRYMGAFFIVGALVAILVVLSRRGGIGDSGSDSSGSPSSQVRLSPTEAAFLERPDADLLRQHMRDLTAFPSVAGTPGGRALAELVAARMRDYGVPQVETREYEVLLAFPLKRNVTLISGAPTDGVNYPFTASLREEPYPQVGANVSDAAIATYNAYGASGLVRAPLVYVNYARKEDFELLASLNFNLTGRIAIARYGGNFRGLKAMIAQEYGIVGLIIYSDPIDDGRNLGDVYPQGPYRPESGVQRGSADFISHFSGDPLTPGVAAKAGVQRKYNLSTAPTLPRIPIQPIGYGDAEPLLRSLGGLNVKEDDHFRGAGGSGGAESRASDSWQGGLPFDYHVGAFPGGTGQQEAEPAVVELEVRQEYNISTIYNVIGTFPGSSSREGSTEVLLGNHRDAWVAGAVDPHSGTACLLELARALGAMYNGTGRRWRPRRTVRLCSWDAEEFGLIGSSEYVEERQEELADKAVVYINVDVAVNGKDFRAQASGSVAEVIRSLTQAVNVPKSSHSVYQSWKDSGTFGVEPLGSGSDYTPFLQYLGVSAMDVRFIDLQKNQYGVYHSMYDDFDWMDRFGDPGFHYHRALTQILGILLLRFSNSITLPVNLVEYADTIKGFVEAWKDIEPHKPPPHYSGNVSALMRTIALYRANAVKLEALRETAHTDDEFAALFNDVLRKSERQLLSGLRLPNRKEHWYKHVVYAPSLYGGYAASVLPGVSEPLADADWDTAIEQLVNLEAVLRKAAKAIQMSELSR